MEAASVPQQQVSPATPQAPPDPPSEEIVLAFLTALLLSGLTAAQITAQAIPVLTAFGLPLPSVQIALSLSLRPFPAVGDGQAQAFYGRTAAPRRAAFIVKSATRIAAADEMGERDQAVAKERHHVAQHLNAERARQAAAGDVDRAAEAHGPVLGWRATMDDRTTPECSDAHGSNFAAERPPAIGWPGTLHGGACRCVAGPPWPQAKMLA